MRGVPAKKIEIKIVSSFFLATLQMEENKFSAIIIGDRVITKIDNGQVNGLRITPLEWVQKSNASFHTDAIITFDTNKEAATFFFEKNLKTQPTATRRVILQSET